MRLFMNNNRTNIEMGNGDVITYTYDGAYRLVGESRSNPQQPSHSFSQSFVYDDVGNRTSSVKN